jgi:serine/threonine protein kinase
MSQSQHGSVINRNGSASSYTIVEGGHGDFESGTTLPFRYIGKLGVGASAVVDRVEDPTNGRSYAQKVFRPYSGRSGFFQQDFKNELDIIKRLHSHPHIIQVYWSYTCGRELGMLLIPIASDKDLGAYLSAIEDSKEGPTSDQRNILLRAFGCLASGLAYIHSHTIRHKDIKPQNILVHNGQMIYTDFGISLDASEQNTTTTGLSEAFTRRYCAPEVANNEPRNRKSDVFSLGCVFVEMIALLDPDSFLDTKDPRPYWERSQIFRLWSQILRSSQRTPKFNKLYLVCALMTGNPMELRIDAANLPNLVWHSQFERRNVDLELFCECCRGPASVTPPIDMELGEELRTLIGFVRPQIDP